MVNSLYEKSTSAKIPTSDKNIFDNFVLSLRYKLKIQIFDLANMCFTFQTLKVCFH